MRNALALSLAFALVASSADAGGVLAIMLGNKSKPPFTPVTHTYNSGSGNETVPANANQVVITVSGGGGGGSCGFSGGNGGKAVKTILLTDPDYGQLLAYVVGSAGTGAVSAASATSGTASTVSGTLLAGAVSMSGNGGGKAKAAADGDPGTASGGDSNITGGGAFGGGIGDCPTIPGSNGSFGQVKFEYT